MIVGTAKAVKRGEAAIALSDASRFSDRRRGAGPAATASLVLPAAA